MQLGDCLVWYEVGFHRCDHNLVGASYNSRRAQYAHPADHGVESDELLNLWLIAHDGLGICFRCRDDKIPVEVLPSRQRAGEMPSPGLGTLAQPGREA